MLFLCLHLCQLFNLFGKALSHLSLLLTTCEVVKKLPQIAAAIRTRYFLCETFILLRQEFVNLDVLLRLLDSVFQKEKIAYRGLNTIACTLHTPIQETRYFINVWWERDVGQATLQLVLRGELLD